MKVLDEICEVLEDELKEIVRNGDMSPTVLEHTYKAVDIIKDIKTIKAMEDAIYDGKYSYGGSYDYDDSYNMVRNRRRMPEHDRGYSRSDDKEQLIAKMEEMQRQLEKMKR